MRSALTSVVQQGKNLWLKLSCDQWSIRQRIQRHPRGAHRQLETSDVANWQNGAGKSSILEALYLASAYVSAEDEVRKIDKLDYIVHRRGGRGGWDEARRFLWHMGDVEAPIKICLDTKDKTFEFEVVDLPKKERPIRHVQPKTETPGGEDGAQGLPRRRRRTHGSLQTP